MSGDEVRAILAEAPGAAALVDRMIQGWVAGGDQRVAEVWLTECRRVLVHFKGFGAVSFRPADAERCGLALVKSRFPAIREVGAGMVLGARDAAGLGSEAVH